MGRHNICKSQFCQDNQNACFCRQFSFLCIGKNFKAKYLRVVVSRSFKPINMFASWLLPKYNVL